LDDEIEEGDISASWGAAVLRPCKDEATRIASRYSPHSLR
jgi:hypothetical protein